MAAEREGRKIAVEIKSFISRSPLNDLQDAVGQYAVYLSILADAEPKRKLYLALGKATYEELTEIKTFRTVREHFQVALVVIALETETVEQWIE
jgi:hypothetical protein